MTFRLRPAPLLIAFSLPPLAARGQAGSLSLPPDSPRWELQRGAKPAEYQGRKCFLLDGGAAAVKDLEMRDAVIDVDVATPAKRGFFGIQFRLATEGANGVTRSPCS